MGNLTEYDVDVLVGLVRKEQEAYSEIDKPHQEDVEFHEYLKELERKLSK